jgi:hypothetical protein
VIEREKVTVAIVTKDLLIRLAARKGWSWTFGEKVIGALQDKGWDVAWMDHDDFYVFNAAQARLSTCSLI